MKNPRLSTTILALLCAAATASAITIDTVTIGNPGNPGDTAGRGRVNYTYAIGTYDVTLTQYTAFLNAMAQTDTYSLYNPNMATDLNVAGIQQNGSNGSYTYSVIGSGQRPVTYVSWSDAARFTNWLHNGQPNGAQGNGTTETGAYLLNGSTTGLETKTVSAQYWIPSASEWHKAAYYDPTQNGGTGGYWRYANRSSSVPGNNIGGAANQANYFNGVYSVTQSAIYSSTQNYLTDVGAFTGSASAYGTYDQNGNVFNLTDEFMYGPSRGLRGGAWDSRFDPLYMHADYDYSALPASEGNWFGFRIATVPEPTVSVSLLLAGGLLLSRRRRAAD
jgi:sulfatase modifying factor 1